MCVLAFIKFCQEEKKPPPCIKWSACYFVNVLSIIHLNVGVEDILLHEFAHGLHLLGARYTLPGFDSRLRALYDSHRRTGKWAGTYAMSTDHELFVRILIL